MKSSTSFIDTFKEKTKSVAIDNVMNKYPQKVIELTALLKDYRFQSDFDPSKNELIIPDLKEDAKSDKIVESSSSDENSEGETPNVRIQSNRFLVEMVALLKPQLIQYIEYSLGLTSAINLMIPAMEDGNNFGVEIQMECLNYIIGAENDIHNRLSDIYKFFTKRAEMVSKAVKYPKLEDFRISIQEKDRVFHKYLVMSLYALRSYYTSVHDLFLKNSKKIKNPKSSVSKELMY